MGQSPGELADKSESSGPGVQPRPRTEAIFINEASKIEACQDEGRNNLAYCFQVLKREKRGSYQKPSGSGFSKLSLYLLLDLEGSPIAPLPHLFSSCLCKVIFLYLLKLLFKEEFLIITQPQRADTVWLCLFSFS